MNWAARTPRVSGAGRVTAARRRPRRPSKGATTGFEQRNDGSSAHYNVPDARDSSPPNNRVQVNCEVKRSGYRYRDEGSIQYPSSN